MTNFSTVVKQFVVDYTSPTFEPLMEHEVNGLDYRYVYGNDRLSVNITGVETSSGNLVENGNQIRLYYHMDYLDCLVFTGGIGEHDEIARAKICHHMDYLGTADYLTSPVTGKVESWTHYNEWGEITHNAVLKTGKRELDLVKRYATHDYDAVLGMYYAKARFYDAENRRFAAMDPVKGEITNPLTMVQYLYAIDCPLVYIDVVGERAVSVCVADGGGSAKSASVKAKAKATTTAPLRGAAGGAAAGLGKSVTPKVSVPLAPKTTEKVVSSNKQQQNSKKTLTEVEMNSYTSTSLRTYPEKYFDAQSCIMEVEEKEYRGVEAFLQVIKFAGQAGAGIATAKALIGLISGSSIATAGIGSALAALAFAPALVKSLADAGVYGALAITAAICLVTDGGFIVGGVSPTTPFGAIYYVFGYPFLKRLPQ